MVNPEPDPIDWSIALEAVEGHVELLAELVQLFLEEYPRHIAELQSTRARGESKDFQRIAHTLKGSLKYFGPNRAADVAHQLEVIGRDLKLADCEPLIRDLESEIDRIAPQMRLFLESAS